jgi:spore photoproduct lyase
VHNTINTEAFPNDVNILGKETMTGRGCGKYSYRNEAGAEAETFLREKLSQN